MSASVRHDELPCWLGLWPTRNGYDLGEIKTDLARRGINARGWRLYLDYGDDLFKPLRGLWIEPYVTSNNAVYAIIWLRILQQCEMDVPPPPALAESMQHWRFPGNGFGHMPPLFFRAAWKACMAAVYCGHDLEAFIWDEIIPVARWYFDSDSYKRLEPGQLKAGWSTIHRLYEEWQLEFNPNEYQRDEWQPFVRSLEWGAFRFQALTNDSALQIEARIMRHCIDTYDNDCQYGTTRAYSVRDRQSGRRIGTASMVCYSEETNPSWAIGQLKGPGNTELSADVHEAAEALTRCFDEISPEFFIAYFNTLRIMRRKVKKVTQFEGEDECDLI